jgi:hypothetical protein
MVAVHLWCEIAEMYFLGQRPLPMLRHLLSPQEAAFCDIDSSLKPGGFS